MTKTAIAVSQLTLLEQVLAYEHPSLVQRLQKKLSLSQPEAVQLFEDTKRFLFLYDSTKEPLPPPTVVDKGWHNFILYTKEYSEFCQKFFGRFIHHCPNDSLAKNSSGHTVRQTIDRARAIFGNLSSNWTRGVNKNGDCTPVGCQPKDCVPGDCDAND